jgi:glycosyltransferase involved in cell wall biosynthesis
MSTHNPKVTVYIPSHNYGRYLRQAVESVRTQTMDHWEMILVDDGSADETGAIMAEYAARYPDKIVLVRNSEPLGLVRCANKVLDMARGRYVMRLDADDFLDENALLVLSHYLDVHDEIALVYANYFYVDENGNYLRTESRKKINDEVQLLDLPAHGACTLVRRRILKAVGGYTEGIDAQDGYDLWLKIMRRYPVGNVTTPLFSYRQHGESLTRDTERILENRQRIKRSLAKKNEGVVQPRLAAIVPAKNTYPNNPDIVLRPIGGKPLIDHTIEAARGAGVFSAIVVTTDDPRVAEYCRRFPDVTAAVRPDVLSRQDVWLSQVVHDAVLRLEREMNIHPDIVATLSLHTPLRTSAHILMAVDALVLYDSDSVVSVVEDWNLHFRHGRHGLEAINPGMLHRLRLEREALFLDNGALKVSWRDVIGENDMLGRKISHIVMSEHDSIVASSEDNVLLIDRRLARNAAVRETQT